ncbi:SLC13 family permease [Leptodesmis sichuanensis]|uniref:SLC13 family permease n=1 Tax=Leptodesmis sichuanensis TaxID=2906798 RepID=UPI002358FFA1|nr:SLC13 family permease [Leptodesmis sichuanensis]
MSLLIFGTTVSIWTLTRFNVSYIAISAALLLVVTGAVPQTQMFHALGDEIIWMMIGAFVLGAAIQETGLATRLTQFVVGRVRTVAGLFWLMTLLMIPLSFLIPSTSGRAAVTLPVFRSVTSELRDPKIIRALALLIPTVILVSTIVSLVGAGSHLIANEFLLQMAQQQVSFAQWALYGLPFGVVASLLSCWVIMRLFLDRNRLKQAIHLQIGNTTKTPWSRSEWMTLAISMGMLLLWLTERMHGLRLATVAITSHLYMTSHAARAVALVPALISLATTLNLNVITAEGCLDFQTPLGKIPGEVAKRAKRYNLPVRFHLLLFPRHNSV